MDTSSPRKIKCCLCNEQKSLLKPSVDFLRKYHLPSNGRTCKLCFFTIYSPSDRRYLSLQQAISTESLPELRHIIKDSIQQENPIPSHQVSELIKLAMPFGFQVVSLIFPLLQLIPRMESYNFINYACREGWTDILQLFLDDGRIIVDTPLRSLRWDQTETKVAYNLPNCNKQAVCEAIKVQHSPILEVLLEDDRFSINREQYDDWFADKAPLAIAAELQNSTIVQLLSEDHRTKFTEKEDALFVAVQKGNLDLVELLARDERVHISTSLNQATIQNDIAIVTHFLSSIYSPRLDQDDLMSAVSHASRYGHNKIIELFLPRIQSSSLSKPLEVASIFGFTETANLLLTNQIQRTKSKFNQQETPEMELDEDSMETEENSMTEEATIKSRLCSSILAASNHYQWDTFFLLIGYDKLSVQDILNITHSLTLEMNLRLLWDKIFGRIWRSIKEILPKELICIIVNDSLSFVSSCPEIYSLSQKKIPALWRPNSTVNENEFEFEYDYWYDDN